jgi:hypothetical protein
VGRTFPGTFVGRAEELDLLLAAEERAAKGKPAVSLVVGDAGIGKTRLLTEFVEVKGSDLLTSAPTLQVKASSASSRAAFAACCGGQLGWVGSGSGGRLDRSIAPSS